MTTSAEPSRQSGSPGPASLNPAQRRPLLSSLLWWLVAGGLALVLLPVNAALGAQLFGLHPLIAVLAAIAQSAALLWARDRPRQATGLQLLVVVTIAVALPAGSASTWPVTVPGLITLLAHIGLVAARHGWRTAVLTWWMGSLLVPLVPLVALLGLRGRSVADGLLMMILQPALSAVVLGAVTAIRRWREIGGELAAARRDIEVEQSHRAVAEERTRIARELHDVVAHGMSVIYMQANSASYRIANLGPEAGDEFKRIAIGARGAMREMRQLLSVLRADDGGAGLAPVPDLGGLPGLVASAERAGLRVEVRQAEAVRAADVPQRVAVAAYRIIQESLSNIIRHAPEARTLIVLDLEGSDLVLSVLNEAAPRPVEPMESSGQTGHGLTGMRERVGQVGGSLTTGVRPEGGYQVTARLPIGGPR